MGIKDAHSSIQIKRIKYNVSSPNVQCFFNDGQSTLDASLFRTRLCQDFTAASFRSSDLLSPTPNLQKYYNCLSGAMAGDTRDYGPSNSRAPGTDKIASHGTVQVPPIAPENANALPGGGLNTAGGKVKEASIIDAAKSIHLSDFMDVHRKPCVRDALMTGIGVGFGAGGFRSILGGKWTSSFV